MGTRSVLLGSFVFLQTIVGRSAGVLNRRITAVTDDGQAHAAASVDSGPVRAFLDRPLGSKLIIVITAAFLVEMLAPWTRVCVATSDVGARKCGWTTGYEGSNFALYAALFALGILVWELLPVLIPRLSMRGWPTAVVTAILGVALALCTLVKVIEDNEFQTGWAWVGLALALAVMMIALIRVRYRWRTRGDEPASPRPTTPPASDSRTGST
jgi:hypothetical protein